MDFRILGPLSVSDGERSVEIKPVKQRTLLATLLCHANQVVSTDSLVDALWGADPPRTAAKNLQVNVWWLRQALGDPGRIRRTTPSARWSRSARYELVRSPMGRAEVLHLVGQVHRAMGADSLAVAALDEEIAVYRETMLEARRCGGHPTID